MANTMRVSIENETVLVDSRLNGIDPDNILAEWSQRSDNATEYTIPNDGILMVGTSQNLGRASSVSIQKTNASYSNSFMGGWSNNSGAEINFGVIPVKKGQKIKMKWLYAFLYAVKR